MERLQILVDEDLASKVKQVAKRQKLTVSALGAKVLQEALQGEDLEGDPWYRRRPYPVRPGTEHITAEDHDSFLYGSKKRRRTRRRKTT